MNPHEQAMEASKAQMVADLSKSALTIEDMRTRVLTATEIEVAGIPVGAKGYVIPYTDFRNKPVPFYRVRLFYDPGAYMGPKAPKYKQPQNSRNHVYFPYGFWDLIQSRQQSHELDYIILTEGEKKAALAVKMGFPCCALGGVENWRNRTYKLPKGTQLGQNQKGEVTAKLPKDDSVEEVMTLAVGMQELIDFCDRNNIPIIIVYDSDLGGDGGGQKYEVLRAAATLGYELRIRGLPSKNIRHLTLESPTTPIAPVVPVPTGDAPVDGEGEEGPLIDLSAFDETESEDGSGLFGVSFTAKARDQDGKIGLDDYLLHSNYGPKALHTLITNCLGRRSAFPRHPNPKEYVGKRLGKNKLSRADYQSISFAIISDMDAKGLRIKSPTGAYYYFDYYRRRLYNVTLSAKDLQASDIGQLLYSNYGVSSMADQELVRWFLPQFQSEEPLTRITPRRLVATGSHRSTELNLYFQLSESQFAKMAMPTKSDPEPELEILDNGDEDILFEAGQQKALDIGKLLRYYHLYRDTYQGKKLPNWWYETLKTARIQAPPDDSNRKLLSLLYYVSPFYNRWQGTELPVEIATGEAGSGKSTLFALRQEILNGEPALRNVPKDMKDFTASASSTGGLYVMDNVHVADKSLKQKLSDEICRLVTEPVPSVEQRKLYTDNEMVRIGINCVFAITAISQPFTNVDIIQRSIVLNFDKQALSVGTEVDYDSGWKSRQIKEKGGREAWIAHQLLAIERIQAQIYAHWNPRYKAKYRLIHLEQLLQMTANVFEGFESSDAQWVGKAMEKDRDERMLDTDAMLSGLKMFAEDQRALMNAGKLNPDKAWDVRDMAAYFQGSEDYSDHQLLCNNRSLGKYLASHAHAVATTAGIVYKDTYANRSRFKILLNIPGSS